MINIGTFALIVVSVSLNSIAQILLRKAMLTLGQLPQGTIDIAVTFLKNAYLWAGMMSYAASIGLWLAVLSRVQVSVAYPMLSMGYVLAAILGAVFLGETITATRVFGIALICSGVFFVARLS